MDPQTYSALRVGHILGFSAWGGALITALFLLRAHARAAEASAFVALEKGAGIAMDVAATIAIVCGLIVLLGSDIGDIHLQHGYMHMKLTAVAAFVGVHVVARIKIKRAKAAAPKAPAGWLIALALALFAAAVVLIELGPVWMA